jgi:hypothetical protein
MTEDMRIIATARIAADRVSTSHAKAGVLQGLKMSVFDWKMWLLVSFDMYTFLAISDYRQVGMNIGISAAYGFSNFFPSIVRGFGYSNTTTLLLTLVTCSVH